MDNLIVSRASEPDAISILDETLSPQNAQSLQSSNFKLSNKLDNKLDYKLDGNISLFSGEKQLDHKRAENKQLSWHQKFQPSRLLTNKGQFSFSTKYQRTFEKFVGDGMVSPGGPHHARN